MDLLFHQNMRTYGPSAEEKNAKAAAQMKTIGGRCGGTIICAGFTEIRSPSAAMEAQVGVLGASLHADMTSSMVVPVGISGGKTTEYIGVAWNNTKFAVSRAGYFYVDFYKKQLVCLSTTAAAGWASMPYPPPKTEVKADFRSLAFLYGTYGGAAIVVAFMHNMFGTGDKTGAFDAIGMMLAEAAKLYAAAPAQTYVGGDFNLPPRSPAKSGLAPVAALAAGGKAYELTTNSNCYDYWLVTDNRLTAINAEVWGQTREPAKWDKTSYTGAASAAASSKAPSHGISDHAGISLILDPLKPIK